MRAKLGAAKLGAAKLGAAKLGAAMLAAALGGCGEGAPVEADNASVAAVADKVAANPALQFAPGRWEANLTVRPNDPAAAAPAPASTVTRASCLTPEQAQRPSADFFARASKDCVYERFQMGGGNLTARMRCRPPTGEVVSDLAGQYRRDRYDIDVVSRIAAGPAPETSVTMRLSARHVGPCRGDEQG